jgi:ABC-type glycerol-3-phosphate transport system substrate-binding protein
VAFQEQACAAADANGGITGGWMIDGTQGGAAAWLLAYAGSLDKSGQYRFEAEEVEDALAFLAGISKEGCAWQPAEPYPDQAFIDRLGLFYPVSTHEIPFVAAAFEDSASTDVWTAIGYPNNQGSSVISVHGQSYVVARSTIPQQVAAWLAIQTLTGERSQAYLAQNHAYLPLDSNAAQRIKAENSLPPQWYQAAGLLEQAAVEPRLASWRIVRSIVQDAVAQVLDVRFEPGTLSLLVRQLAEMAAEYNQ